jgi:L-asparaginase II
MAAARFRMDTYAFDVVVERGSYVESRHRAHAAIVDVRRGLVGAARDPSLVTAWRSCAKPFQVMPLLEAGGFEELGWCEDELALACASHAGEPEHVAVAESMLKDLGLEEGDLACGPHEPLSKRGQRALRESGNPPSRLHNNCSGKHAAMLARAHVAQWETNGYERLDHPVQQGCLATISTWTGVPVERIPSAIDGCGVPVFFLPLEAMAAAYARFADAIRDASEVPSRIAAAMRTRPFLVGGSDRFDTIVLEETGGQVISKIGAEGVHCVAIPERRLGFALKVEDGASRAHYPIAVHLIQRLGGLPDPLPPRLQDYARPRIRNTRGETVGEVRVLDA